MTKYGRILSLKKHYEQVLQQPHTIRGLVLYVYGQDNSRAENTAIPRVTKNSSPLALFSQRQGP